LENEDTDISETTQEYPKKNFKCCQQIRILHNKIENPNKKCLPVWLYLVIAHTCLVAGNFFLKPEVYVMSQEHRL
jgi:hypothetical protein